MNRARAEPVDRPSLASDNGNCFVAGTLVRVHQSTPGAFEKEGQFYKNVEDVRAKDLVLSWNEKTGDFEYKPVVQNFIRTADKIYQLTYEDGTVIETTWSHPFYIEGSGWVKAEELRAGDVSKTGKGTLRIRRCMWTCARKKCIISRWRRTIRIW